MDPIMKLLEDDEDESLHSGADVEAFTAVLNREVEASASSSAPAASSSQPMDHGIDLLPQENNTSLNHGHGQWQDSVKSELANQESQQQEQTHLHLRKDQSSRPEVISQGSDNEHLHTNAPKECDLPNIKQEPGTTSQQGIAAQQQPLQQMKSQQTPGTNQTNNAPTTVKTPVVTFHMLIPILRRHLDKDKDMQVQSIFAKLRKNEISKEHFLKVVRSIVGDKLLKQAASQYQMQHAAQAQQNPQTNPSNYSLLNQVSGQQNVPSSMPGDEQKASPVAHPIHVKQAIDSSRPPQFHPSSSGQMQSNMGYPASESNIHKANEMGNKSDGKGVHMLQTHPPNVHSVLVQPMQHNVQCPQIPSPVFGTNNFHARPFPRPVGGPVASLRPQMCQHNQRAQLVQGAATTISGSVPTQSTVSGSVPPNQSAWQRSANKEHKTYTFTPTPHMNMGVVIQHSGSGQNSFAALHAKQVNSALGSSKGADVLENQSPVLNTSKSLTIASSSQTHQSHGTQAEPKMQIQSSAQGPLAPAASKTPQRKASSGQKKPLEALGSSPTPSSKRQKASAGFHDQSIDQLNDVTAVSGVNLKEEEEQLFSAPKEECRVSEAARKVVQLEEEKLILQKGLLTKKLAEIIRKCNLKVIGADVERCLSMGDGNSNLDSEKDKTDARATSKNTKTHKEEDGKMRTTAANVAARVAAGGDDILSKWQLLAEGNKQRNEGGGGSSGSLPGNMLPHKPSLKSGKDARVQQEIEKGGYSTMLGPGGVRRSPVTKVVRSITVRDVIAALEREPQMSKSSMLFQLYGRSSAESVAKNSQ
ncbi:transcription initiation factor TFIID subunit 4b-like isoform X2 [Phragmites australis]|uniref:transcription initiation factor TFIID subunit 4b-like isoform X2 n=1 Tax=Phragmites australis TaxID=29695 RepID=UPI002D7790BE|nr:transcription initiation factor TFIID subunit 4b-like isoform X2 [Phragmites australis]